jgi:hypothetical protein
MLRIAIKDSSGERVFATERDEVLVGGREGADVRLRDPAASPNHCILRAEGGRVRLLGLSSRGSAVGGRMVAEAMLAPGQEFAVGDAVVRILATAGASRLAIDEPPGPPSPAALPPEPPPPPPAGPHDGDFAREVRATLAQAPWYLVSLMVHVAILLLMSLIDAERPRVERIPHIAVAPPKAEPEPELPPDTPLEFEEHDEGKLDEFVIEEPPSEAVRATPSSAEAADYSDVAHLDTLGTGDGRRPVTRLPKPLAFSKTKGGDKALDKGDLKGEQGRATDTVKKGLGDGLHEARQRLSKEHIVVVRGAHDKIEAVLDGYEWKYTLVTREDLLLRGAPKARILFVNCSNPPPPAQAAKLGELVKRLLNGGCWVVTSDWSVAPYLTEAFPSIVKALGAPRSQRDTTVEVEAVGEDPLLSGVFPRGGESHWWLEDSSTMVSVTDKATTLVVSDEMRVRYGSRIVAFKFPYGEGVVIHLVGHFYQEDGNLHGLVAMHRLINNVIVERVHADRRR